MKFTTGGGAEPGLQLTRAHRAMTDHHFTLERELDKKKTLDSMMAITRALREFEEFSHKDREQFLQGGLTATDGDRVVGEWVADGYDALARMARELLPQGMDDTAPDRLMVAPAWALAVLLAAHASKWRKMCGRLADAEGRARLHKIFRSAVMAGIEASVLNISIDRRVVETTVESLYVRALLIDRFGGGNLSPKRLEILDSWLIAWMGSLWLSRKPTPGVPTLAVDTANPARGLARHISSERADFFLAVKPLQRQLDRAIESFHQGEIFPGWGIGLVFRMEEHIAVLDFVERELNLIENASTQKAKRFVVGASAPVSVFTGFNDVYNLALTSQSTLTQSVGSSAQGSMTGAFVAPAALRFAAMAQAGALTDTDPSRSPVLLLDISESGLGLEMAADDAAKLALDELIAVRVEESKPCVLGIVVRKANVRNAYSTTVGVKVITKMPLRANLELVTERTVRQSSMGIFVAGHAGHGFADSIIVTDSVYRTRPTLKVMIASGVFHIRLGRVRHQGVGWKLAAVDVVEAR